MLLLFNLNTTWFKYNADGIVKMSISISVKNVVNINEASREVIEPFIFPFLH